MMTPVISIVGKSRSGKTTLIEKLIVELKKRGYKIGIIKHAGHGFEMDKPGKDSWRHQKAGADAVMVADSEKWAMVKKTETDRIDGLMPYFEDMDLVLTEGYKRESKPKIEIFRSVAHEKPLCIGNADLIAFVSDTDLEVNVPRFGLEEIKAITDFIESQFLIPVSRQEGTL